MNARLRDRLAAAVSIALLAALSLFTLYLAQRAARNALAELNHEPVPFPSD